MSIRTKRILSEIKRIEEFNKINTENIYIHSFEENINKFMVLIIGPKDVLYEGGFFLFEIILPDLYPFEPPIFKFISPMYSDIGRIHPNLYKEGKVCLSILNTWGNKEWSSSQNIISVCNTIQSLLDNDPILHEPPNNRVDNNYKIAARYKTLQIIKDIYNKRDILPDLICNKIYEIYNKNIDLYVKKSLEFNNINLKNIKYFHGEFIINYQSISQW